MVALLIDMWKAESDDGALFSESLRYDIVEALELLGADARPALDVLLDAMLNEQTPAGIRLMAARTIGNMRGDADTTVPKLLDLLNRKAEGYARVINSVDAAQALGLLGPAAKLAGSPVAQDWWRRRQ